MITKNFTAVDENLEQVINLIHTQIPSSCPEEILNKIDLAVEEIYVNISHYAYKDKTGDALINCSFEGNTLEVQFIDSGIKFNPLEKADPDITAPLEERDIGGLGIFLTKKFMDSVDYEYKDNKNVLTIKKRID